MQVTSLLGTHTHIANYAQYRPARVELEALGFARVCTVSG